MKKLLNKLIFNCLVSLLIVLVFTSYKSACPSTLVNQRFLDSKIGYKINDFSAFIMRWDSRSNEGRGDCVAPGNNCTVPSIVNKTAISNFLSLIEEDNESEFFTDNYDWQTMFPELIDKEDYLNMIIYKEVHCRLIEKPDKLIFLFILNEDNKTENEKVEFVCQVISEENIFI